MRAVSNRRGMTMVEIMIGMALLMGIMLAVVEVTTMSQRSATSVTQSTDWNNLVNQAQLVFANEQSCKGAMQGITLPAAWFASPYPPQNLGSLSLNGTAIMTAGQPATGLQVTGLTLNDTGQAGVPITMMGPSGASSYTQYFASFQMTGKKVTNPNVIYQSAVGRSTYQMANPILVSIFVDASNTIQDCYGQISSAGICNDFGGTYNAAGNPHCTSFPHNCEWVSGTAAINGSSPAHRWVPCPNGKYPVAGGGSCPSGATPPNVLTDSTVHPDGWGGPGSNTAWGITCENQTGVTGNMVISAYCCQM